jgi:transposase-like protein
MLTKKRLPLEKLFKKDNDKICPLLNGILSVMTMAGTTNEQAAWILMRFTRGGCAGLSSKSIGMRATKYFKSKFKEFNSRPLNKEYVAIICDGTWLGVKKVSEKKCFLAVEGLTADNKHEVLSIDLVPSESEQFYVKVLKKLIKRGLLPPEIVVGDGSAALWAAISVCFPGSHTQQCFLHLWRSVKKYLPGTMHEEAHRKFSRIYNAKGIQAAKRHLAIFKEFFNKYAKALKVLDIPESRLFGMFGVDRKIRKQIYTSNLIESFFAAVKNFTRRSKGCMSLKTLKAKLAFHACMFGKMFKESERFEYFDSVANEQVIIPEEITCCSNATGTNGSSDDTENVLVPASVDAGFDAVSEPEYHSSSDESPRSEEFPDTASEYSSENVMTCDVAESPFPKGQNGFPVNAYRDRSDGTDEKEAEERLGSIADQEIRCGMADADDSKLIGSESDLLHIASFTDDTACETDCTDKECIPVACADSSGGLDIVPDTGKSPDTPSPRPSAPDTLLDFAVENAKDAEKVSAVQIDVYRHSDTLIADGSFIMMTSDELDIFLDIAVYPLSNDVIYSVSHDCSIDEHYAIICAQTAENDTPDLRDEEESSAFAEVMDFDNLAELMSCDNAPGLATGIPRLSGSLPEKYSPHFASSKDVLYLPDDPRIAPCLSETYISSLNASHENISSCSINSKSSESSDSYDISVYPAHTIQDFVSVSYDAALSDVSDKSSCSNLSACGTCLSGNIFMFLDGIFLYLIVICKSLFRSSLKLIRLLSELYTPPVSTAHQDIDAEEISMDFSIPQPARRFGISDSESQSHIISDDGAVNTRVETDSSFTTEKIIHAVCYYSHAYGFECQTLVDITQVNLSEEVDLVYVTLHAQFGLISPYVGYHIYSVMPYSAYMTEKNSLPIIVCSHAELKLLSQIKFNVTCRHDFSGACTSFPHMSRHQKHSVTCLSRPPPFIQ